MTSLLDSDRTIDYLTGMPAIRELVDRLRIDGIAISVMTYAEVYEGVLFNRFRTSADGEWAQFLTGVLILPHAVSTARRFAAVRGSLRATGTLIPDADIWIAATALEHDLTLVTGNRRHFERVPGLRILG